MLSSSPLPVRGFTPSSTGSSSFKRQVSRGATASCPRPSSSLGGGLGTAVEAGVSVQQLQQHFSLSSSARRNVASSPTGSSGPTARAVTTPSHITVGFAEPASTSATSTATLPAKSTQQRGLLSRALVSQEPRALQVPLETVTESLERCGSDSGAVYFPGVDRDLLQQCQERHDVFRSELVSLAYMLAAKVHEGQTRKDGTSQLSHCVMTALHLAELGLDEESIAAGLLHECLRANPLSRSQLEEFMPASVLNLVDRVTTISEISHLYRNNREALGEEKMRRMLLAMEDVKAMLVKLACRVHNMTTISALPRHKQISMAQETLEIFSVVANRLGIWSLKAQLEDAAFAVLHPEEYEALHAQVERRRANATLQGTIHKIQTALDKMGVQYEDVSGRPKSLYGIWCKMKESNITSLDKVYDVIALRVVVTNKHDCYRALRAVQETYRTMSSRSKDYIKENKKPNGYQSLHETIYGEGDVPVEVQIRTHKMHYIAEYGFAAHWKYKEKLSDEDEWLNKEVQYKKWLTTYKLCLNDKKVRASGAPPRETALHSLGMHLIDGTPGSAGAPLPGVDPFLRHDRFRLEAPTKQHVSVMLQTQDSIETREYAVGTTVEQVTAQLKVDLLPGYVVAVNQREQLGTYALRSGDLIQVLPKEVVLARSPPQTSPAMSRSSSRTVLFPGSDTPVEVAMPSSSLPTPHRRPPLSPGSDIAQSAPRPPVHPVSSLRASRRRSISDAPATVAAVCV